MRAAAVLTLVSAIGLSQSIAGFEQSSRQDPPCPVTLPTSDDGSYGTSLLTTWLWPDGIIVFQPRGSGFVTSDLALGMKFGWARGVTGKLNVSGHRLDGAAGPLRLEANNGYGDIGFQASYLIFPTAGCWAVSAQVGERADSKIEFVTRVVKLGDGPTWRRDPPGR
jgi:hypothetical protein